MTNQEDRPLDLTELSKQMAADLLKENITQEQAETYIRTRLQKVAKTERDRLISGDEETIRQTIHTRLHDAARRAKQEKVLPAAFLADIATKILQGKENEL